MAATSTPNPSPEGEARRLTVVVLAGGDPPHPGLRVPEADLVVAADSGAEVATDLGLTVDVLVGDLDSVDARTLGALRGVGTRVERHHPDKDATDLELALAVAAREDPQRIVLVGGHGGRLDHALSVPGALAAIAARRRRVEAWLGPALLQVTVDRARIEARPGEQISLLAWGGPVHGLTTHDLRWPLRDFTLEPGSTRGISNEATDGPAAVAIATGTLLVIRPHALSPSADERPIVPDRPGPQP